MVRLHTNFGVIGIELNETAAPISAKNFLHYVNNGHYNQTLFHRVIDGFMIQGGGFDPTMKQKPTAASIQNEANNGLKNETYTVAMARTGEPHSATSQFFINVANNAFLDHKSQTPQGWGYCVFGKVVEGTEVVDKIKGMPTAKRGFHDDVPQSDVMIERAEVV